MAKSRFRQAKGYSESLKERTEQNTGGGFITIFKDNMNLPIYKEPKSDDVGIDIIPYLATANHPQAEEGEPVYKLELWVHQRVGPEKGDYVCLRNFGEECPLCEARFDELAAENPRKKVADSLKGSHRAIYNVVVVTNDKEYAKGVQIWTASTYLGETKFQAAAKNRKTGDKIPFSCPDEGRTIWFTVQGSMLTKEFAGIQLEVRPEIISEDILDQAFDLEDCIIIPKVEELEKIARIVLGSGYDSDGGEPEPPARTRRGKSEDSAPSQRGRVADKTEAEPEPDKTEPEPDPEHEKEEPAPTKRGRPAKTEEKEEPAPSGRSKRETTDDEPAPRRQRIRRKD